MVALIGIGVPIEIKKRERRVALMPAETGA